MTDWNYVIWKYEAVKQPDGKYVKAFMPPDAQIIRMDHVDDGFYKGDFIWAIVNPTADIDWQLVEWNPDLYKNIPVHDYYVEELQLGVLEEQIVRLPKNANILHVKDFNGLLWLYYEDNSTIVDYELIKMAIYKTGQDFKHDVYKMEYLGFCSLWILQELGLYVFKINV